MGVRGQRETVWSLLPQLEIKLKSSGLPRSMFTHYAVLLAPEYSFMLVTRFFTDAYCVQVTPLSPKNGSVDTFWKQIL